MLVWSSTRHTRVVVADVARSAGLTVGLDGPMCWISGAGAESVLLELDAALTPTERAEARAVFLPAADVDASSLLGQTMGAPTLKELAARIRFQHLAELPGRKDRFYARYQPIVSFADGSLVGHEALLRARSDLGQEIPAGDLFGAAEAGGWTHVLDRIGRETAIRDAAPWLGDGTLFINFVPTSIYRPEICLGTTLAAADRHGVALEQLVFEVVETHATDDPNHLLSIAEHYRQRGAKVALDDVGAGYATLGLVALIQPDIVKIDMGIVQGVPEAAPTAIVRAIVELSHGFGAKVIAEGVETEAQADTLRELGADWGQGWFFGRPQVPADLDLPAAAEPLAASGVSAGS